MTEHIPFDLIKRGPNDRTNFDAGEIAELAKSIEEHGLLQPIAVRPNGNGYEIIAGERRYRASFLVLKSMPCIIHRDLTDEQASALMLTENVSRQDLDPIDEANAYHRRMTQFEWDIKECSGKAGVSVDRVRKRLNLLDLRDDIQHLVAKAQMPIGHAEAMHKLDHNRQTIASRPLVRGDKINLRDFRTIVDELYAEQLQDNLFSTTDLLQSPQTPPEIKVVAFDYPIASDLPPMAQGNGHTGTILARYIKQLEGSGKKREAEIVGFVLKELVNGNYCRIPLEVYSPITKLPLETDATP